MKLDPIERAKKAVTAVYLACHEDVAKDISEILQLLIQRVEAEKQLTDRIAFLEQKISESGIEI